MPMSLRTAARHATTFGALVMLALAGAPAFAGPGEDASRVVDRWAAAYSAQDTSAVLRLYAADAILFGTVRPMLFDGSRPIGAAFAGLAGSGNTVRICQRHVLVVGEDAVLVTGSYEFQARDQGIRETIRNRFTMMVAKPAGEWRISYHTTSHPLPGEDFATGRTASIERATSALPIVSGVAEQDSRDACRR